MAQHTSPTACCVGYKVQFEIIDSHCSSTNFQSSIFVLPSDDRSRIAAAVVLETDYEWHTYYGNIVQIIVRSVPDSPTKPNLKEILPVEPDATIVKHKLHDTFLAKEILKYYAYCLFEKGYVFVNRIEDTNNPSAPVDQLDQYIYKDGRHYLPNQFWKGNLRFEYTSQHKDVVPVEDPFKSTENAKSVKGIQTRYWNENETPKESLNFAEWPLEKKQENFNRFCDATKVSKGLMYAVFSSDAAKRQFSVCFIKFLQDPSIANDSEFQKEVKNLFDKFKDTIDEKKVKEKIKALKKAKGGVRKGKRGNSGRRVKKL